MKNFDRRNLLAFASGGFFTLAASGASAKGSAVRQKIGNATMKIRKLVDGTFQLPDGTKLEPKGTGSDYGPTPTRQPNNVIVPKAICTVYMKFDGSQLIAKHAFYKISDVVGDHQNFAESRLNEMASPNWPISAAIAPTRPGADFKDFIFGGRQKIYMHIDNGNDVVFDEFNLIKFTRFAADPDSAGNRREMTKNASFKGAKMVTGSSALNGKRLLYVENRFRKFNSETFEDIGGDHEVVNQPGGPVYEHSMNIHFLMKSPSGARIPIVIDPAPTNGGGYEP